MTDTSTPAAVIPLARGRTDRARNLRTGNVETWETGSDDGVWWFRRVEMPGTPWEITHLPTGMTNHCGSLDDARTWAGSPAALRLLHDRAQKVVDARGFPGAAVLRFVAGRPVKATEPADRVAERHGLALRAVHVLEGRLAAGDPDGLCLCGGLMRGPVHADVCPECVGGTVAEHRKCRLLHLHRSCTVPEHALCDHVRCTAPAVPAGAADCSRGRDRCCGCCHEQD